MGYVGLPTALALVESGSSVIGYDISEARLAAIKTGAVDLAPADQARLEHHLGSDPFVLTTNPAVLASVDTVMVCVPTPIDPHFTPDLTALSSACETVIKYAVPHQLIILTSTTYVGATRQLLVEPLSAHGFEIGKDVFVAFSPERIDPGNASFDHSAVPRVIGAVTKACQDRAVAMLERVTSAVHPVSSPEAAEITKLLENSFRAVNIALVNEFAEVCGYWGLDVIEVIEAAATKPFGFMPFYPGPGVGGHCIPCDPHYLLWQLRARRARLPVTEAAMTAIALRPRLIVDRARQVLADSGHTLSGARVLVAGVTYKPGVSDLRGSPALEIMVALQQEGAEVAFTDPLVGSVHLAGREVAGVTDAHEQSWDLVVVHTQHPGADYSWLSRHPRVLDTTYRATYIPARLLP
ncbi:MAG: nucleotide sugar dehydrogenase [Actinomycetota bacterium]|nr:nucleotide sugar dehydrogenase [Actinomycetota bacterium]